MTVIPVQKSIVDSLTLRSVAVIAVSVAAQKFGVALPDGAASSLVGSVTDLLMTFGLIGVAVGRSRARGPLA